VERLRRIFVASVIVGTFALAAGAAPAAATKLYAAGTALGVGTTLTLSGDTTLKVETTGGTMLDTCTMTSISAKLTNSGGSTATVSGSYEKLQWGSCTENTTTVANGSFEIHHISGSTNGTFTTKQTVFAFEATIFGAKCSYTAGEAAILGTLIGSTTGNAQINVNTVLTAENPFFCPDARLTVHLVVTSPSRMYVEAS
jgi:hypothetical protein